MTKILSTIIGFIFFGSMASAQLTEFSQGDILSAGAMNQNFKYLEDRFGGLNEKTVDCGTSGTGSGINAAIKDGYNSIIVKGICKENISILANDGNRNYLKLKGFNNDQNSDKIVDNSSNSTAVIKIEGSMVLKIDNLTLSGGDRGIRVDGTSSIFADNITVESYTSYGIQIEGPSYLELGSVKIDGTKQSANDDVGVKLGAGSYGYFHGTTTVNGNSSNSGGIAASGGIIWMTGTVNLDSNKQSLVIESGGKMGLWNSTTTISNSTDYGIKAYFGQLWNYGTMTISDSSDGNWGVLIDRSGAYLSNLTVTGGSGSDPLIGVYDSILTLNGATIKNHQGSLINANRSTMQIKGTNSITNDSSSSGCMIYFEDVEFSFEGNSTINGTNNSGCSAFNMRQSSGRIDNIVLSSPKDALYAVSSDVKIRGGSFSSTQNAISIREGSRFLIGSEDNDLSITSSGDDALEIRSSYVKLDKGSNNLTISTTSSGDFDITNRSFSTLEIEDHTYSNVEVKDASNLIIDDDATITTLTCTTASNILKSGTVTNAGACSNAQ